MEARDAWIIASNIDNVWKAGMYASIALWAHPTTRPIGRLAVSYMTRVTANMAIGATKGALTTPFVRKGPTPGQMAKTGAKRVAMGAGAVAGGYALGSVVGTGIAYAGWGKSGANDAIQLYTGQVSAKQYYSTVSGAISQSF